MACIRRLIDSSIRGKATMEYCFTFIIYPIVSDVAAGAIEEADRSFRSVAL